MSRRPPTLPGRRLTVLLAVLVAWVLLAPGAALAESADSRYQAVAQAFHDLRRDAGATPAQWRQVAEDFRAVHTLASGQRRGIDALYSTALAYREAWRRGAAGSDLTLAVAHFRDFADRYPRDRLADDALMHLAALLAEGYQTPADARATYERVLANYPNGDQHAAARRNLAALLRPAPQAPAPAPAAAPQPEQHTAVAESEPEGPTGVGRVHAVQHWSTREGTRVILTVDAGVRYEVKRLAATPHAPERVYFDLAQAEPDAALAPRIGVDDGVLEQIRISRHDRDTTRVVLDLTAIDGFEVKDYRLADARKIVVDLQPTRAALTAARARMSAERAAAPVRELQRVASRPLPEPTVQVPLATPVRSIMIDPGHGGHDPGAVSYGVEEKDLVLDISKRLRDLIRARHPDLRVGMTRETDEFIPLHERPQLAKNFKADLFVSVHLNANTIRRFHGVETYFLNVASDEDALQVAERENATAAQPMEALNDILMDLLRDTTLVESGELAKAVQASLVGSLRARHKPIRDLGVKQAPFLVLMGAEMPSVLVEAGFVTNRAENQRLRDPDYLTRIAEGIYDGLRSYIEQQNVVSAARAAERLAANDRN